jgi:hypothetical protein
VNAMKIGRKYAGSSRFAEQFAASPGAWCRLSDRHHVPAAGCLPQRLLCVGEAATVAACAGGCRA